MKSYVVGIDIGGTNTKLGIVDSRGTVLAKDSIKTNKHQCVEDYIEDLHKAFTALTRANGLEGEIGGIGVGAPNANYFKGTIEYAANLPWKGIVPFAELMEKKFGIPVKITNDANAAAIGEMTYGAARGVKDFIMITLGTGVGSGIVANGQLIYGSDGNAGELGHVIVRPNGRLCGCGRSGCLETYTSATGVARRANFSNCKRPRVFYVVYRFKTSPRKMFTMLLWLVTDWHLKFLSTQGRYWEKRLPISFRFRVPK